MKTVAALLVATAGLVSASPIAAAERSSHVLIPYDANSARPLISPNAQSSSNITAATEESTNWSGAGFTSAPSSGTYTSVTGTFTIPKPKPPTSSGSGTWYGTAWVGIDGNTVSNALFQGGVDWSVTRSSSGSLSYSYQPWIEWIPDSQVNVNSLSVTSGQSITVTCTATSSTEGYCTYVNNTTGKSVKATSSAPSSSAALQGQNVEWIVEDFTINNGLAPFANYGTVEFTGCSTVAGGDTYGIDGAELITLEDSNGNTESSCTINSNSELTCTYQ